MKNTATYGMTNVTIEKEVHSGTTGWFVYADTERWGKHQIMAQFGTEEWAINWCKENGVEFEKPSAWERAEQEVSKSNGKIQIGNVMYRNLYIEDGQLFGHSNGYWGWRNITKMIDDCKMIKKNIGKTNEHGSGRTVKFGNACTW